MKKFNQCEECGSGFLEPIKRDCFDICDECYTKMQERIKWANENRMELSRMALCYANSVGDKEAKLRGFFACVMPELPQVRVNKLIRSMTYEG